jgi:cell wall-associated NlpC family hydrolase
MFLITRSKNIFSLMLIVRRIILTIIILFLIQAIWLPRLLFADTYIEKINLPNKYCQSSEPWGDDILGNNTESKYNLSTYGCFVTSLAMIYCKHSPGYTDPGDLNERLKQAGAFEQGSGNIYLSKFSSLAMPSGMSGKVGSYGDIDNQLKLGNPVLAIIPGLEALGGKHAVVIIGKENNNYIVVDPTYGKEEILNKKINEVYFFEYEELSSLESTQEEEQPGASQSEIELQFTGPTENNFIGVVGDWFNKVLDGFGSIIDSIAEAIKPGYVRAEEPIYSFEPSVGKLSIDDYTAEVEEQKVEETPCEESISEEGEKDTKASEIVELAESQEGNKTGNGPFEGIIWADSQYTYCDRFVSAVIEVAYGNNLSADYHSGYKTAYDDYIAHKSLIEFGEMPKGAIVFFDKDKENQGFGHVGIYEGNGNIISVVNKEQGVLVLPKEYFQAPILGWINFEDYKSQVKPVEEPGEEETGDIIEDLSFSPSSPSQVGTSVNIHAKATWDSSFRAMRLNIDGSTVYELGSSEFNYTWNTSGYSEGYHTIRLEVAATGDNSWSNPTVREKSYYLTAAPTTAPTAPPIEDLSFSPSSPSQVGTSVNIHAKATWDSSFRAMRLNIDGSTVYELGSSEFNYTWNTSGYSEGYHTIRLEVAATGDNSWSNPTVREKSYYLTAAPTTAPTAPPIEELSFSPSSPSQIGTSVNIYCRATWTEDFRAMRLKIDGSTVYELGSSEFNYTWNTSGYSEGYHTIRLEVAATGDNSWSNPTVREKSYELTAAYTPTPTAPPIEELSFSPSSPSQIGTSVNIYCRATWTEDFRAMRLKIDGSTVYELGSPEFDYTWNTSGYSEGSHTVRLEVAATGDNSWSNPTVREKSYYLQPKNVGLSKPTLSSPSNGSLLPPGTDITLRWNLVSGATEYIAEIWGGQYGGTHNTLGGWQSGTSRHIGTMSPGNVLWRVKARNSSGVESPWSDEWNFTPQ